MALRSLNIPPRCLEALLGAGMLSVEDVLRAGGDGVQSASGLSREDSHLVVAKAKQASSAPSSTSALALLRRQGGSSPGQAPAGALLTFVKEMDEMLGSGVPLGRITEFCGAPGAGKTQLGMQLAVDAQFPRAFGGLSGDCIYIDTEGSFVAERLIEIGTAFVAKVQGICSSHGDQLPLEARQQAELVSLESVLNGVHYYRCHNYVEQIAVCNVLREKLQQFPATKLIVMDSVAFHFRRDWGENYSLRNRLLNNMAHELLALAREFGLAVVLMNQVTTKFKKGKQGESETAPALGEAWGHAASNRVMLHRKNGARYATLFKSASRPQRTVEYRVTQEGVRGVEAQKT